MPEFLKEKAKKGKVWSKTQRVFSPLQILKLQNFVNENISEKMEEGLEDFGIILQLQEIMVFFLYFLQ